MSGRGIQEFDVPKRLAGRDFVVEAKGGFLGPGFKIEGIISENDVTKHEHISFVHSHEKAHVWIPARYERLGVTDTRGGRKTGRWSLEYRALTELPDLLDENEGEVSRILRHRRGETRADVKFQGTGCVRHFSLDGRRQQELVRNVGSFHGTITIPGEGLIAISADPTSWGPLQKWKLTLK
ncbi:hypothetical protein [Streptomyces sp. NPDC002564]|uniref:hypothetical protein n=1 Tax=Streptomyces sp. NPDC002564 TaxID=3364649 RepID=UPI0036C0FE10